MRLARARQEHVEDRQRAAELAGAQVDLHLLGDEKGEAQDRAERTLDIVECGADAAARQFRQIGHRTDRLERAQHIGRRLGIEGVGVEEVRAREHVEHGRPRRGQIGVRPGADLRQLALLELRERAHRRIWRGAARPDPWSAASAANPPTAAFPPGTARYRRRSRFGGARRQHGREQHGSSDCRDFQGLKHLYSRPGRMAGDGSRIGARLRKTA